MSQILDTSIKRELDNVREQLDDHLQSINENTDDLENNYSYLVDMDQRLKLLENKLSQIYGLLSDKMGSDVARNKSKIKLSEHEQCIFTVLYTADRALDYVQLCSKSRKSEYYVRTCINTMIEKGVPIKKHVINKKAYFVLDRAFKELQTRENILNIEKTLTLDCFDQRILG